MIAIDDLSQPSQSVKDRNWNRSPGAYPRCLICYAPIKNESNAVAVYVHRGGSHIVTDAEYDELEASDSSAGLGTQYIGSECARKNRAALKPYAL